MWTNHEQYIISSTIPIAKWFLGRNEKKENNSKTFRKMIWIVKVARWLNMRRLAFVGLTHTQNTNSNDGNDCDGDDDDDKVCCVRNSREIMHVWIECRLYTVSNSLFAWIIKSKHRHQHHFSGEVVFFPAIVFVCVCACVRACVSYSYKNCSGFYAPKIQ